MNLKFAYYNREEMWRLKMILTMISLLIVVFTLGIMLGAALF